MVQAITFLDENLKAVQPAISGQHLVIRVHYRCHVRTVFKDMRVMIVVNRDERATCILSTDLVDRKPLDLEGSGHVDFHVPHLPLCGGRYYLHAAIENNVVAQDWVQMRRNFRCSTVTIMGRADLIRMMDGEEKACSWITAGVWREHPER